MNARNAGLAFVAAYKAKGFGASALDVYTRASEYFAGFLELIEISDVRDLSETQAQDFSLYLSSLTTQHTATLLRANYRYQLLCAVKKMWRYWKKQGWILADVMARVLYPKVEDSIPFRVLDHEEIDALIAAAGSRFGWWGSLIIETLYGTGLRNRELCALDRRHVDVHEGVLWVESGKGGKDRVVPLPSRLKDQLAQWLEARPVTSPWLFPKRSREARLEAFNLNLMVAAAKEVAGIKDMVTPHCLRHTYATHLLEAGLDIRYIKELLGHERVITTQIYTRVRPKALEAVYRLSHPRA